MPKGPERLRACRAKRGLRQDQVAGQIDVSQSYYSLIERGLRRPSYDVMVRIAKWSKGDVPLDAWPVDHAAA